MSALDTHDRAGPVHTRAMRPIALALRAAAVAGAALLAPAAPAQESAASRPAAASADAAAACERAARQSITRQDQVAAEIRFNGAPTVQPSPSGDGSLLLQGGGQWKTSADARRFEYRCSWDPRSPDAVGLVMRDTTPAGSEPKVAKPAIEPDLSFVSPAACESSAAAALKKRWPRVSQISFDPQTRSLAQESAAKAMLRGQGRAQPAPGEPTVYFSFDCELDPRNGRVAETRIGG